MVTRVTQLSIRGSLSDCVLAIVICRLGVGTGSIESLGHPGTPQGERIELCEIVVYHHVLNNHLEVLNAVQFVGPKATQINELFCRAAMIQDRDDGGEHENRSRESCSQGSFAMSFL
jgi:hypothetical protein